MIRLAAPCAVLVAMTAAMPTRADEPLRSIFVAEVDTVGTEADHQLLAVLGDDVRGGVITATRDTGYTVLTREQVEQFNEAAGPDDCLDASCLVQNARKLTASAAIGSRLLRPAGQYVLTMVLHDVATEAILGQEQVSAADPGELRRRVPEASASLIRRDLLKRKSLFGADELRVPVIHLDANHHVRLSDVNIEAEKRFETAMLLHDDAKATPRRKADAWCALAAMTENNPYLETAKKTCNGWRQYLARIETLKGSIQRDYKTVGDFLKLRTKSPDDKLAIIDDFIATYAVLGEDRRVLNVQQARPLVARTGTADLSAFEPPPPSGPILTFVPPKANKPADKAPRTKAPIEKGDPLLRNVLRGTAAIALASGAFLVVTGLLGGVLAGVSFVVFQGSYGLARDTQRWLLIEGGFAGGVLVLVVGPLLGIIAGGVAALAFVGSALL